MEVGKKADDTKGKDLLLTDLLIGHRAACSWRWHDLVAGGGGASVWGAVYIAGEE